MAKKKSFIVYHNWKSLIAPLSLEDKGRLLDSMFSYNVDGEIPDFSDNIMLNGFFSFMMDAFNENNRRYEEQCEQRRNAARKRWENKDTSARDNIQPNTTAYDSMLSYANYTDNDTDNDIDIDIDNDKDIDTDTEYESDTDNGYGYGYGSGNDNTADTHPPTPEEVDDDICQEVIGWYDELCPSLIPPRKRQNGKYMVNKPRKERILHLHYEYDEDEIKKAFRNAEASDLLTGREEKYDGSSSFVGDFDQITKESNFLRLLEGSFNDYY